MFPIYDTRYSWPVGDWADVNHLLAEHTEVSVRLSAQECQQDSSDETNTGWTDDSSIRSQILT